MAEAKSYSLSLVPSSSSPIDYILVVFPSAYNHQAQTILVCA